MTRWTLQTAKNRFSEVVERARKEGPQLLTRRGADAVIVLSVDDYRALGGSADSDLVDFFHRSPLREVPGDYFARAGDTDREIDP
jgi:prevent-host-death family protein